jgi:hypothetical protein
LTFNGLHGVIFQNIELFMTTAKRTSNPAMMMMMMMMMMTVTTDL